MNDFHLRLVMHQKKKTKKQKQKTSEQSERVNLWFIMSQNSEQLAATQWQLKAGWWFMYLGMTKIEFASISLNIHREVQFIIAIVSQVTRFEWLTVRLIVATFFSSDLRGVYVVNILFINSDSSNAAIWRMLIDLLSVRLFHYMITHLPSIASADQDTGTNLQGLWLFSWWLLRTPLNILAE